MATFQPQTNAAKQSSRQHQAVSDWFAPLIGLVAFAAMLLALLCALLESPP